MPPYGNICYSVQFVQTVTAAVDDNARNFFSVLFCAYYFKSDFFGVFVQIDSVCRWDGVCVHIRSDSRIAVAECSRQSAERH